MRTLIENYRGFEIYFNTDKEEFYTISNEHDTEKTKKSYASTKKFIDDFLKKNINFKPINVMKEKSLYSDSKIITLIGIRKDGAFTYEDKEGNKQQLSKYDEKDYFAINSLNDKYFEELDILYKQQKDLSEKIKETNSKIIKFNVEQIRQSLNS